MTITLSIAWYFGTVCARMLNGLAGRSPSPRFVVLYYHGVPTAARTRFARQMHALSRRATVVRAAHVGVLPTGSSYVAITFDDALRSVFTNAVPELARRKLPATIFVPVNYLGQSPGWETCNGSSDHVMSLADLQSLPDLIEVGSHGLSHARLTQLDAPRLHDEIAASRRQLAQALGRHVSLLAFPYGDYDHLVVGACREAGYERLFGIDPRLADPAGRDFVRGRVPVNATDGPLMFRLKAHGGYGWMTHASALKRRLASWSGR